VDGGLDRCEARESPSGQRLIPQVVGISSGGRGTAGEIRLPEEFQVGKDTIDL
jgi:hypothetical protein